MSYCYEKNDPKHFNPRRVPNLIKKGENEIM